MINCHADRPNPTLQVCVVFGSLKRHPGAGDVQQTVEGDARKLIERHRHPEPSSG